MLTSFLLNRGSVYGKEGDDPPPASPNLISNPIHANCFSALVRDFTDIILKIGLPLAALMIIFSGFQFVLAGGNEEKIKKARQMFYWTIIGAAVIIGARVIAEAVVNFAKGLGGGEANTLNSECD